MALLWESQEAGIHLYRPGKTKYDLVFKASTHYCLKYCLSKNKIDYSRLLACSNAKSDLPGSLLNGVQPICKSKLHSRGLAVWSSTALRSVPGLLFTQHRWQHLRKVFNIPTVFAFKCYNFNWYYVSSLLKSIIH